MGYFTEDAAEPEIAPSVLRGLDRALQYHFKHRMSVERTDADEQADYEAAASWVGRLMRERGME